MVGGEIPSRLLLAVETVPTRRFPCQPAGTTKGTHMQGTDRKYVTPGTKARAEFAKLDARHGFAPAEIDELEGRGVDITGDALDRGEIVVEETRADKERYGAIEGLDALVADFLAGDADGDKAYVTPGTFRRQHAKVMQLLSDRLAETVGDLLTCEPDDLQLRCVGAVVSQWVQDRFGI